MARTVRKNSRRRRRRQTDRKTHRGGFVKSIGRALTRLGKPIKRSLRSLRLKKNYSEAQRAELVRAYNATKKLEYSVDKTI